MFPIEVLKKYNMNSLEEYKAVFGDTKNTEITFYETFLQQTDYIPNKIIEILLEDMANATLTNFIEVFFNFIKAVRIEYKEVLEYRKKARAALNTLLQEVNS